MAKRDFSKVSPAIWRSPRFRCLENDARLLQLFFICCDHQNSAGAFVIPAGYACSDLQWTHEQYVTARDQLRDADLIAFDEVTDEVYVRRWFAHNPPTNDKHAQGTLRRISEIQSDEVREIVEADFDEADSARHARTPPKDAHLTGSRYLQGAR
jgi:hypothetical protein